MGKYIKKEFRGIDLCPLHAEFPKYFGHLSTDVVCWIGDQMIS